ncbi:hypothetical protein H9L39_07901, partial [Fusarium oxysporum f. sp. albedinis]
RYAHHHVREKRSSQREVAGKVAARSCVERSSAGVAIGQSGQRVNTWLTEGNAMKKPTRVVSSKIGIVMVAETYSGEDRERQQRRVAPDTSHNQDQGGNPLDNSPWAVDNNGDEVGLASSNYTRLKSTDIATNSSRLTSFPAKISRINGHPQH